MNLENEINNSNQLNNEINIQKNQNDFLESILGKTINTAVDIGLKYALPDIIENEIISIKDSLIKGGLKEGINTAIDKAINIGKSAIGIFTGNFENISQAQTAVKTGGIIDGISSVIDSVLNKTVSMGLIDRNISNLIKNGKNVILDNVSRNIEDTFTNQLSNIEKLSKYENNWREYYNSQDFEGMEREYNKITEKLNELMPLENTLKEARIIENIHNLIKNNGQNFSLTNEQIQLAKKLI